VFRRIGVSEQSYYRWRKEYGGLKVGQARRLSQLLRIDDKTNAEGPHYRQ
jgi:hypothetical protein